MSETGIVLVDRDWAGMECGVSSRKIDRPARTRICSAGLAGGGLVWGTDSSGETTAGAGWAQRRADWCGARAAGGVGGAAMLARWTRMRYHSATNAAHPACFRAPAPSALGFRHGTPQQLGRAAPGSGETTQMRARRHAAGGGSRPRRAGTARRHGRGGQHEFRKRRDGDGVSRRGVEMPSSQGIDSEEARCRQAT